jgi:hypothetical protein
MYLAEEVYLNQNLSHFVRTISLTSIFKLYLRIVKKIRTYGTFTLYELDPNNLGKAKEKVVDL